MKALEPIRTPRNYSKKARYRNLSLVELVKKIVGQKDRLALEEFHNNRTLFRYSGGPPLRFSDFLRELRESEAKRVWPPSNPVEVADLAYDLTLDKFNSFPRKNKSSRRDKSRSRNMKRKGTDCRLYFNAFLKRVAQSLETEPPISQIEEEGRAARFLQSLVSQQFYLSLLEAKRKVNPFWSRYNWRIRGSTICVWLPVSLAGRERRKWLEKNIDDPDPLRPGERERIQSIIGRELVRERFVPFDKDAYASNEKTLLPCSDSGENFGKPLAAVVANEKARYIGRQRPSIRALGKRRVKKLVLRIFRDLSRGKYEDQKVSKDFGLSKATFSRFAGSKWLSRKSAIPDLLRNTAEVLSTQSNFKEVAIGAGVWGQVKSTLKKGKEGNEL